MHYVIAGKYFYSNKYKGCVDYKKYVLWKSGSCGRNEDKMKLNSTVDRTIWGKKTMSCKFSLGGIFCFWVPTHPLVLVQAEALCQGINEPSKLLVVVTRVE